MKQWLLLGAGAVSRECFLPAFEHLGTLPGLTVVDLVVPADLRDAYPCVRFIEGDFREAHQHVAEADGSGAVVALPNQFHEEAAVGLLRSGMHVLCEKPLALSELACRNIAQVAVEARRLLAVNMIRRCYPSFATVERIVRDGQIGRLESIRIEHGGAFAWPTQSISFFSPTNGGVFADMGVHYLDLAEWWAGLLQLERYHDDARGGVEAEAEAQLRSASDVAVHLRLSRIRRLANKVTLMGSDGRIELDCDSISGLRLYREAYLDGVEIRPLGGTGRSAPPDSFGAVFVERLLRFQARIADGDISTSDCDAASRAGRDH